MKKASVLRSQYLFNKVKRSLKAHRQIGSHQYHYLCLVIRQRKLVRLSVRIDKQDRNKKQKNSPLTMTNNYNNSTKSNPASKILGSNSTKNQNSQSNLKPKLIKKKNF